MKTKKLIFIVSVMVLTMLSITCLDALASSYPVVTSLEAPQNLRVETQTYEDGTPYFNLIWTNPQSIKDLFAAALAVGEAPMSYQIDVKAGNSKWTYEIIGDTITGDGLYTDEDDIVLRHAPCNPIHLLENLEEIDAADIESNVFYFRVRYSYLNPHEDYDEYIYSPFSNVVSTDNAGSSNDVSADSAGSDFAASFSGYSEWAYAELTEAEEYGLITDSIRTQMNAPITREEFAELAVRLVETIINEELPAAPEDTFTDTKNTAVLKAYFYGIVSGVGDGRFDPKALTNREQIATMTGRILEMMQPTEPELAGTQMLSDEDQIFDYALHYVKLMAQYEIIKGSDGQFRPKDTCTREQAVLIVKRMYESIVLSMLTEFGEMFENDDIWQDDSQAAPQDVQSIVGGWSDSGSGYDEYSHGNLINSYYSGKVYIFNADGTFRYAHGGSWPTISGMVVWDGSYSVSGDTIYLTQIKQSWQPWPDDVAGGPAYTDKAVSDTTLQFEFLEADILALCEEGRSTAYNYYRVKE